MWFTENYNLFFIANLNSYHNLGKKTKELKQKKMNKLKFPEIVYIDKIFD